MAKTLDVLNVEFGDLCGVTGIDISELRRRMNDEDCDSALVWVDGEPVIVRHRQLLRDRVKHG